MLFTQTISSLDYKSWILNDRENKRTLKFSALAIILSFGLMKIAYPFPNFMPPDSNSYLRAAFNNQFINLWPIGYSKFVRLVSSFTSSHFILVLLQYLLLQTAILYFLFSIRYFFAPGKWAFRILLAISILNPLVIHLANFVSSDALFTTLSLVWFTQLMWIIYRPQKRLLAWHATIIVLAFIVRFTAVYYPFISIAVIAFCPASRKVRLVAAGWVVLLLVLFIGRTAYEYKIKTNTIQYSAMGAWQIASNALYGYAYAKPIPVEEVPAKFRALHEIVNRHMQSLNRIPPFLRPDREVAVYYFWDFNSPLRVYMSRKYPKTSDEEFFYKWAKFGPLYASYGRYLINKYPAEFLKYYLWPNFLKYYAPPTKFMGVYNMKSETVEPIVVTWFGWKNHKLPAYFKNREIQITMPFPVIFATINIIFVLGFISYIILGGLKNCDESCRRMLWITVFVWFTNMAFSVFAAPIELRYQIFPMVFTLGFSWLLMGYTIQQTKTETDKRFMAESSMANAI